MQFGLAAMEILQLVNPVTEERGERVCGMRPLDLHGRNVRLAQGHVKPGMHGNAFRVKQHVAVGEAQPEVIFREPQQHGVVDDAPVLGGDQHVLALADLAFREVAGREQLHELRRVRTRDFDLPFDCDIPEADAADQRPVVLLRGNVVGGHVHAVVHREALDSRIEGRLMKGGFADAGTEVEQHGNLLNVSGG